MERIDKGIDKGTIGELLTRDDALEDWPLSQMSENTNEVFTKFSFWISVLDVIDASEDLSYKHNLPIILKNLNFNLKNISSFIRKIRNMQQRVSKTENFDLLNNKAIDVSTVNIIGSECESQGITIEWLQNPSPISVNVTNKLILELRIYKNRNYENCSYKQCALWVKYLCNLDYTPKLGTINTHWERIYNKKTNMKDREQKDQYLMKPYTPPSKICKASSPHINKAKQQNTRKTQQENAKSKDQKVTKDMVYSLQKEKMETKFKLFLVEKENKQLESKLLKNQQRLATLSLRNVNKRVKRRDVKIMKLIAENKNKNKKLSILDDKIKSIRRKYKKQSVLLRHYRNKTRKAKPDKVPVTKSTDTDAQFLKDRVKYLENENLVLDEKIQELLNDAESQKTINTFHGGKYCNEIREVYAALLSMNVGVKNVEHVVRTVLSKLTDVNVDRLPKKSFAEMMLIESKALAQIHAVQSLISSNEPCTLHTDGTKRGGREYGGLQIGTSSGQFSFGISEIVSGTADSFFTMIQDIFNGISKLMNKENIQGETAEIVSKIKNMMTDRHIVNSSLKERLEKWRSECLPLVIKNFDSFPDSVKEKFISINDFKCNLHVLVNLATQAESALKLWEKSVLIPSDSNTNFVYSTSDFVRAVTKLCVPGADEKSGYGLLFKTFLENLDTPETLRLSTFHGHRINVLFTMAAAVFFHRSHVEEFIDSYFNENRNRLVSAISTYLSNDVFMAGCRALGIVDKLITGPIWRQIESSEHILDLNETWFIILQYFERFSKDASELLDGNPLFPDYTEKDSVFECLFNVGDEDMNILTIEALQILFTNFQIIINRQLKDNLPGGKFNKDTLSDSDFKLLKTESTNVSTTNIVSERDFANLDRLQREKPNANTIALEGMILFTNNKTLNWLESLDPTVKENILNMARKCAPRMLEDFKKRKNELKEQHAELLRKKKESELNSERRKINEILNLNKEIQKWGGLWQTVTDMEKVDERFQLDAVKCQIKYHKVVLKSSEKSLTQFSSQGKAFSLDILKSNLRELITRHNSIQENVRDETQNIYFEIKNKEEREKFMKEHRLQILKKVEEIKTKNKRIIQRRKRDINSKPSSPKSKKPKKADSNITDLHSDNDFIKYVSGSESDTNSENEVSDSELTDSSYDPTLFEFKLGQTVAVAYSDTWYPGQVLSIRSSKKATVKFLHPMNSKNNSFCWPRKPDESEIENIFVFYSDFDIFPKDSGGRTWGVSSISVIESKFSHYKNTYF